MKEKIVIFGAGMFGHMAMNHYGSKVEYFIDNDTSIQGKIINGLVVRSVADFLPEKDKYTVVVAGNAAKVMAKQLEKEGVTDYILYTNSDTRYYQTDELIFNPYKDNDKRNMDEKSYNRMLETNKTIDSIREMVEDLYSDVPLFSLVEIETLNQCNGNCDFCPVSRKNDNRTVRTMSDAIFKKIIDELSEMNYSGRLTLFGNNEPFLDPDIIERHKYAREKVPNAKMHLYTNGTLLNIEKFIEITKYLDELIIDNYHPELKLIKPCEEIAEYCKDNPEYGKKVTIVLRNPHEILTSRGGDSPNRKDMRIYAKSSCTLPFKQLEIRSEGKVSLCCCDPLGKMTLGDVSKNTLKEIWYGEAYRKVRDAIYAGRENIEHCKYCDFFEI